MKKFLSKNKDTPVVKSNVPAGKKFDNYKEMAIICGIATIIILYASIALSIAFESKTYKIFHGDYSVGALIEVLNPINIVKSGKLSGTTLGKALYFTFLGDAVVALIYLDGKRINPEKKGIEQGSAGWLYDVEDPQREKKYKKNVQAYEKKMIDFEYPMQNLPYDNHFGLSFNARKTRMNLHTLIIGGSGAGKTRYVIKPEILQMNCSFIVTDPSGELYRDMGQMLKNNHYNVKVFNTFDPRFSMQYNPLQYIKTDSDVMKLVTTLIKNTGEATGDNKYFDDATKLLLNAIILYLKDWCEPEDRNFSKVMEMVVMADVPENAKNPKSDLDQLFDALEKEAPNALAVKMYKSFKSTSGKSLKSVLSSTATRLTVFNFPEIERLTCTDTIALDSLGDEKSALFIITPPSDNGFNFLVAMMYSQLFDSLYYHAQFECQWLLTDKKYIAKTFIQEDDARHVYDLILQQKQKPEKEIIRYEYDPLTETYAVVEISTEKTVLKNLREETKDRLTKTPEEFQIERNDPVDPKLPFHVRMLMDEFANINEIPDFVQVLSTIRKYNMSIAIVLQALSQLKKSYEKDFETIVGNCDTFIFLGANDQDTLEYVSKRLGDETITVEGQGESLGKSKGHNRNYSQQKRSLMTPDEIGRLSLDEQIVLLKNHRPFRLKKYDLNKHPNISQCADGGASQLILRNEVDLEKKMSDPALHFDNLDISQEEQKKHLRRSLEEWKKEAPQVETVPERSNRSSSYSNANHRKLKPTEKSNDPLDEIDSFLF